MDIKPEKIPASLKSRDNWVVWKYLENGDKPKKMPFQVSGEVAKADDKSTWTDFEMAISRYYVGGYEGIGYEFDAEDPFCGIDLDGCRDPKTGKVSEWARKIILEFKTYSEVSPSGTGVKLYAIGKSPMSTGKKKEVDQESVVEEKKPAVEIYDHGRYFAMTGQALAGMPGEPADCQKQIDAMCKRFWPEPKLSTSSQVSSTPSEVADRARKYIARMPPAISGSGGHNSAFHVACVLVLGFGLPEQDAYQVFLDYNKTCDPPWNEREILHKLKSASSQPGQRNYLRDATPEQFSVIKTPTYRWQHVAEVRKSDLSTSARDYLSRIQRDDVKLVELGIPDLDCAIAGGVEWGEMVVIGARSGHGKSLCALQIMHNVSLDGHKGLIISEEMSSLALGKRAIQFASVVPEEYWRHRNAEVEEELERHFAVRQPVYIAESCGTSEKAAEVIEDYVKQHQIKVVAIDYMQFLKSRVGTSNYDRVSNSSTMLRQVCSKHGLILIALVQLNREIEKRSKFVPMLSDIRDSGSLEQDADVVIFVVWPHRINKENPPFEYQLFVAKNRNRAINDSVVQCRIEPGRQRIVPSFAPNALEAARSFYGPGAGDEP